MIQGQEREFEAATHTTHEALAIVQEIGDVFGMANVQGMLGRIAVDQGRFEEGRPHLQETLRLFRSLGDMSGIAFTLDDLATLEIGLGSLERAIVLSGAAENIRKTLGGAAPTTLVTVPKARERAASILGDDVIQAAWARGQSMSLEEALSYALEQ